MNISFSITAKMALAKGVPDPLLQGIKTVTRRRWSNVMFERVAKRFDNGHRRLTAWTNMPFLPGAERLGYLDLTCRPYREPLKNMPESDVYHEGNLWISKEEFIEMLGCPDELITVIRFKFTPLT